MSDSIADLVFDTINDNWGNGGYGGAPPTITTSETAKAENLQDTDVIEVRHFTTRETQKKYHSAVDRIYDVTLRIRSKNSAAQLQLLIDEVDYILRNTTMTGYTFLRTTNSWAPTSRDKGLHACDMTVTLAKYLDT